MCQHPPKLATPTANPLVLACGSCGASFVKPEPQDAEIEALMRAVFLS